MYLSLIGFPLFADMRSDYVQMYNVNYLLCENKSWCKYVS